MHSLLLPPSRILLNNGKLILYNSIIPRLPFLPCVQTTSTCLYGQPHRYSRLPASFHLSTGLPFFSNVAHPPHHSHFAIAESASFSALPASVHVQCITTFLIQVKYCISLPICQSLEGWKRCRDPARHVVFITQNTSEVLF